MIEDPDRENGLMIRGHTLVMTYFEVKEMLAMGDFTPGSKLLTPRGKTVRVEWGQGKMQVLA